MEQTNSELVFEEAMVLESVFGDEIEIVRTTEDVPQYVRFNLKNIGGSGRDMVMQAHFSEGYPNSNAPAVFFEANWMTEDMSSLLERELRAQFSLGDPVIYTWVEWIKENMIERLELTTLAAPTSSKKKECEAIGVDDVVRSIESAGLNETLFSGQIVSGEPVQDRKSTFQAHLARIESVEEVALVLRTLNQNNKIARATHNIMAYRFHDNVKGLLVQDQDDDGENGAGSRLLHLLQILDARGVIIVVSRWYGGIQLGPDRFKHINRVARDVLEQEGFADGKTDEANKKKR